MTIMKKVMVALTIVGVALCLIYKFERRIYSPLKRNNNDNNDNNNNNKNNKNNKNSSSSVRILCWIKTNPNNIPTKAQTIKATWGRRCDVTLYMSSKSEPSLPAIGLNTSEGREFLTDKAMRAFHYVYKHHLNDADWFFAADDDTYAVVENLRHFLSEKDPNVPIYYGHHFHVIVKQGYSSGGSGYVLSREALRRLGKHGYDPKLKCELVRGADDAEIGKCLEKLNVVLGDSRDAQGRSRFHCFDPGTHVVGAYPDWYLKYDAYGAKKDFLSDYAISFHYISPDQMRNLDYLIYHLRPFATVKDNMLRVLAKNNPKSVAHSDIYVKQMESAKKT